MIDYIDTHWTPEELEPLNTFQALLDFEPRTLNPAANPIVATMTRSCPALASGSTMPTRLIKLRPL